MGKTKKPHGRPTKYSQEIADKVVAAISSGRSLRSICSELDVPVSTVLDWVVKDHNGFSVHYETARQCQFDIWADEILDHSDTPLIGEKVKTTAEGGIETTTGDCVDRARLKVDARKWLLSKLYSKKFGDRTELVGSGGGPIQVSWQS